MPEPASLERLIRSRIRDVPDFPKSGILYKDITPLLADVEGFAAAIGLLGEAIAAYRCDAIVAIESRGFIFGAALAMTLKLPLQIVRKPGKLPADRLALDYALEYGSDRLEIHTDAIAAKARYAIVDDVLATGGTAAAAAQLVGKLGGEVVCAGFLIELEALGGRGRLGGLNVERVLTY